MTTVLTSLSAWVGQLPNSWRWGRLGPLASVKARLGWRGLKAEEYVESGYIFLATPNIKGREIDFVGVNFINEQRYVESPEIMLREGDVLLAKDGSTLGTTNVVRRLPAPATVNSSLAVVRVGEELDAVFLNYFFKSGPMQSFIAQVKDGMGVPHLFQADIRKFDVPVPERSVQRVIAGFLDRKTAAIDALIAKKERLIELLQEKRQALITQAVTKGLDPKVQMKDSGVEWIGSVPTHWEVLPLLRVTRIVRGRFSHRPRNDPRFYGGRHPFIQTGDVANAGRRITGYTQTLNELGFSVSKQFPKGTLAMVITGAKTGEVAILDFDACFPDSVVGFVPGRDRVTTEYLYYLFGALRPAFDAVSVVSTQENLNVERIGAQLAALPPLQEQHDIVRKLDVALADSATLCGAIKSQLDKLREYRQALITAAVTGKLDLSSEAA